MLLDKVDLLESQTRQYKVLISNYEKSDTLKEGIIAANKEYYNSVINSLNDKLKTETKKRRIYQLGTFGTIGVAILSIILIK